MNKFVAGFLDAPLLIDNIEGRIRRFNERNRLAFEMYSMNDQELAELQMSRGDIPTVLRQADLPQ
jgi:uncharacterized protein YjiS (DUF1127 family)